MKLFSDIVDFLKTITFFDYVFFFAVVTLLILIITLIYFIKSNDDVFEDEKKNSNDLEEITRKLETEKPRIEFTSYEKDQEEKAIISYEELLKKSKNNVINYDEEKELEGLSVKKINLDQVLPLEETPRVTTSVRVISYQKEEDFLQALKKLQNALN